MKINPCNGSSTVVIAKLAFKDDKHLMNTISLGHSGYLILRKSADKCGYTIVYKSVEQRIGENTRFNYVSLQCGVGHKDE